MARLFLHTIRSLFCPSREAKPAEVSARASRSVHHGRKNYYAKSMQIPPQTKHHLHVALYPRSVKDTLGNPTYHWALHVSDGSHEGSLEACTKNHVKNTIIPETGKSPWRFESLRLTHDIPQIPLIHITIAEVDDHAKLVGVFERVNIPQGDPNFNCRTWVRDAIRAVSHARCLGRRSVDWETIEKKAFEYVATKRDLGRWRKEGPWEIRRPATWDLIEGRETVP